MALIAIASALIGVAVAGGGMVLLAIGFLVMGAGLAVPYALAPRLALSALSPAQSGQGSGIVNACTFLGGSAGVAGGATAFALGGFPRRADDDRARRHPRRRPQPRDFGEDVGGAFMTMEPLLPRKHILVLLSRRYGYGLDSA